MTQSAPTGGTHTCTLTIKANGACCLIYGSIIATGAAGLVQTAYITDGFGNVITSILNATTAGTYNFPFAGSAGAAAGPADLFMGAGQTLVLSAATSTVSDTQTFAVAMRLRPNAIPQTTFADSQGTPTITINTRLTV